jgi:hypothetical protein
MKADSKVPPEYYTEQEVEIPVQTNDGELIKLFGTLTRPAEKLYVRDELCDNNNNTADTTVSLSSTSMVLFVVGSGPIDRNENARGAPLNVFNSLARWPKTLAYRPFDTTSEGLAKAQVNFSPRVSRTC